MSRQTIFVLASDLGISGPARQLALTLPALPRDRFTIRVGVLGECGSPADELRKAGIVVERFPVRHAIDITPIRKLQKTVRDAKPDVLHAVGPNSVRLSAFLHAPKLIASAATSPGEGITGWLTRRRLRQAHRVLVASEADSQRYRSLGVLVDRLNRVDLAVSAPGFPMSSLAFREALGLPPHARMIFAAGRFDRTASLKDAVWAFDILKYESPDLFLVVFGEGAERTRLEAFGKALGFDDYRVRFAGTRSDLPSLMSLAEVVWITHDRGGRNTALEAMAVCKPVLGWNSPDMAEIVRHGESGLLVPRGDRVGLASKTRAVLEDASLAARMSECGSRIAREHSATRTVEQLVAAYR